MDEDWYHMDPVQGGSLSVSGAKLLLKAPAKFEYARRNGSKHTKAMDLGTRVHALVLGKGEEQIELLDFPNYTTNKAREARDAAIAAGKIPTKPQEMEEARAIADAVLKHPTTGGLFTEGDAEVSMFWRDEEFKVMLRGRADYMTYFDDMPTIVDFKTSADASAEEFARSVYKYGYHRQDPHYREGWAAILKCDWQDIDFVFAVAETDPPYCVATYRVDPADTDRGREQNRIARERFRDCTESGTWPGYSEEIENLQLPAYGRQQIDREINEWHG
jgi:hypothetical protein